MLPNLSFCWLLDCETQSKNNGLDWSLPTKLSLNLRVYLSPSWMNMSKSQTRPWKNQDPMRMARKIVDLAQKDFLQESLLTKINLNVLGYHELSQDFGSDNKGLRDFHLNIPRKYVPWNACSVNGGPPAHILLTRMRGSENSNAIAYAEKICDCLHNR